MKFKFLLISVFIAILGAALWFTTFNCGGEYENAYTPRSEYNTPMGIKGAFEYYNSIKSNIYTGEIEPEDVIGMRHTIRQMDKSHLTPKNDDVTWTAMGPDNVGGRTRAILPFPDDPNTIIAGSVSGGLFKSTDAGQDWTRLTDFSENLIVSTIAMLGNGAIYVGTGNSRESGTSYGTGGSQFGGGGLFVSNDDGDTWSLVSDFEPDPFVLNGHWFTTDKLEADPNDPDKLWVGTNFGLYPYHHGDEDLGSLPEGLPSNKVGDFVISADGENIIVAMEPRVYVSTDGGSSFNLANNGPFSATSDNTTIDLAISPDDKDFMVASVAKGNGALKGIYATQNAGQTWNVIAPENTGGSQFAPFTGQGNYDNMITIVPGNNEEGAREIIMGGSASNYKYTLPPNITPGIFTWEPISSGYVTTAGGPPHPNYVHPDMHTSAWDSDGRLYIGCDGGIFRTDNAGLTWTDLNRNFVTTQYYAIAFSPEGQVLGGTQDNGTLWLSLNGTTPEQGVQFGGGDGFSCEISQIMPNFMFGTLYYGSVYRSATGGGNITPVGDLTDVSQEGGSDFTTDIAFYENPNNTLSQYYVGFSPSIDNPYLNLFPEGQFELSAEGDTIIGRIPAGTEVVVDADHSDLMVSKVLDQDINFYSYYVKTIDTANVLILHNVADTAYIQEKPQFLLAATLSNGVYVTRDPVRTNATPKWYQIHEGENSNPTSVEWSPDGDILYVGFRSGKLVRYKGFNNAWDPLQITYDEPEFAIERTVIREGYGAVMDIEVDYSDGHGTSGDGPASERVAIAIGNYGGSGKVLVSNTAASTTGAGSFEDIWNVDNDILGMPCYSIVMDVNDPNVFLVGTEYGVYYSDNNGDSWSVANNGDMNRVPVFDLRQQKLPSWTVNNSGVVYAGTHGRGIFRTDYLLNPSTGIDDVAAELPTLSELTIYPNPIQENGTVKFDLGTNSDVSMAIYTLEGRLVKSTTAKRMETGKNREINFNAASLATGTYIVQIKAGDVSKTGKFIKTI